MSNKLSWYMNRLKTMSIPEVWYRAGQAVQKTTEKSFVKKFPAQQDQLPVPIHFNASAIGQAFFSSFALVQDTDYSFFGHTINVYADIDWHLDISSGKKFPKSFSKDIDIRSGKYGSAKVVWEINRLQFLLPLLLSYVKTKDPEKLERFIAIMTNWKEENPYLQGVNWYSNIEVNIRLINWYWCWLILSADADWKNNEKYKKFREEIWLPLIYQHCFYSYKNPSYYSSANNHLISEYSGLFIASTLWQFSESSKWLQYACTGLEKEIVRQHSVNGVNKEEAAEYIQFITDFFLLAYVAGEYHGSSFSGNYTDYLLRIGNYINNFLDIRGNFPRYGDEDDGRVILPDNDTHGNNFISILNTLAVIFDKPAFKRRNAAWDIKSGLLTAYCDGKTKWEQLPVSEEFEGSAFYEKEGHFIFRKQEANLREIYCHFDAAPLGYLSIAAHGHADALAFCVNIDGFPFLTDPGTFTYHTHPVWRKYFVSTLAHNTIAINGENQSTLSGPTMWTAHYTAKTIAVVQDALKESVTAEHTGYEGKGIHHRRNLDFDRMENVFFITDDIENAGGKTYHAAMPFHLHPEIKMEKKDDDCYILRHPGTPAKIELHTDPQLYFSYTEAAADDPAGWYSPSFMVKKRASVLTGEINTEQSISIHTTLKIIM